MALSYMIGGFCAISNRGVFDMGHISFTKAVALGNDFVILDARKTYVSLTIEQIRMLANRRQGIGCDQLILILPPTSPQADLRLRFFNADGSEAGACGNGTRCVARLIMENEGRDKLCIQTGETLCYASWADELGGGISVAMGMPRFEWSQIPLSSPEALRGVAYHAISPFCVNIGNPHAVFFVKDVEEVPLAAIGPRLENHWAFPERANVGFAQVMDKATLRLRVWERGSGYTMACGTGACAAAIAAVRYKLASSPVWVIQEGGELLVDWREGHPVTMTGPASIKFYGGILID